MQVVCSSPGDCLHADCMSLLFTVYCICRYDLSWHQKNIWLDGAIKSSSTVIALG